MEKIPSSSFSKLSLKTKVYNTIFVYAVNKEEVRHLFSKKFQNSNFKKIFIKIAVGKAKNDPVTQIVWLNNIRKKRKEIFLEKENIFPPVWEFIQLKNPP